ncbi:MAG: hypothetical protein EP338_13345 [Bacteroidetes bacterium]|nr:MAG: hypothetical protein EP338_13345 [Bacteroidota bacterium]
MNKFVYILLASVPLWYACSGEEPVENKNIDVVEEEEGSTIVFNIPSPSEQFELISMLDGEKDIMLVSNPNKRFVGTKQRALNFGVYIADLAYMTSFDETSKYMQYFNQLEKIGNELGVTEVFTKEMGDMVKKWNNNPDSLFQLSNETYSKSFQKLVDIDKGNELSLMLAGGWIETMYLIFGTSKGFGKSPEIDQIIADQKLVAENLIDFMIDYQDNADVSEYMNKMGQVLDLYNGMDCKTEETSIEENDGKISISGGDICELNQATFDKLKQEITTLRTEVVKN